MLQGTHRQIDQGENVGKCIMWRGHLLPIMCCTMFVTRTFSCDNDTKRHKCVEDQRSVPNALSGLGAREVALFIGVYQTAEHF